MLFFSSLATALAAREPAEPTAPWTALAETRPRDALRLLSRDAKERSARLAWAAAMIGRQPSTDDNMRAAEAVLAELERGDDDVAAEAAYLRARIYQLHLANPDDAQAAGLYAALADRFPASHWAQLGLVKMALLKLYAPLSAPPGPEERLAQAEAILGRLKEPLLRRDLHLQIGKAGVALRLPVPRFLPHLVEADRIGGVSGTAYEDLIVQIGVLSERVGNWAQARAYFQRYLAEFPTNVRAFTIEHKLAAANERLAAQGTP